MVFGFGKSVEDKEIEKISGAVINMMRNAPDIADLEGKLPELAKGIRKIIKTKKHLSDYEAAYEHFAIKAQDNSANWDRLPQHIHSISAGYFFSFRYETRTTELREMVQDFLDEHDPQ
jgi:hypothetical protein